MKLSIVIPVFNEEENLFALADRINIFISTINCDCEVIFVDDHSNDRTPFLLKETCTKNKNYSFLRLSRNSGSHIAIIAGLNQCKGNCCVFLAADLQDPPELIEKMKVKWEEGNQVVWAVRKKIEGISFINKMFSKLFYKIFNASSSVKLPPTGADFALIDKKVVDSLLKSVGNNPSLGTIIASLGFRQVSIEYVKESRKFGTTKWTLAKKINAFIDAIVGFSFLPMRIMTYFGLSFSLLGFIYALVVISLKLSSGKQIEGWASLMVVVLVIGGVQMIMLGVIGEYLWRNLEESRKKPLFFIEEKSDNL